jgi:hypothetical protein
MRTLSLIFRTIFANRARSGAIISLVVNSQGLKKALLSVPVEVLSVLTLLKTLLAVAAVDTSSKMSKVRSSEMSLTLPTVPERPSTIVILVVVMLPSSLVLLMVNVSRLMIAPLLALLAKMVRKIRESVLILSEWARVTTSLL